MVLLRWQIAHKTKKQKSRKLRLEFGHEMTYSATQGMVVVAAAAAESGGKKLLVVAVVVAAVAVVAVAGGGEGTLWWWWCDCGGCL
jgi:uncharacterized RmlC-like cupin family protein